MDDRVDHAEVGKAATISRCRDNKRGPVTEKAVRICRRRSQLTLARVCWRRRPSSPPSNLGN